MTRRQTYAALFLCFVLGAAAGAVGGYRHARSVAGVELLSMLHRDAASTLESYERIRQLVQEQQQEKLMRYLDGVIDVQSAALRATAMEPTDPNRSQPHD